ncbi:MAG: hypothetical protein ACM34D_01085 [Gemmatimonadota bacterium]|jgi:hypothetical protein
MSKKKPRRLPAAASSFDQARDEMFSHILRCGVIEALPEHQKEWFDDTMQYLADRYPSLSEEEFARLRTLGERYCQPVQRRPESERRESAGSVAV